MVPAQKRIILLGNGERPGVLDEVERLKPEIAKYAEIVGEDFHGVHDFSDVDADLAVVFGGDGSVLRSVHQLGNRQLPVIAVNLGTLAFLADVQTQELVPLLSRPDLLDLPVTEHLLLTCRVCRNGETIVPEHVCVNEVCIQAQDFRTLQIELYIDAEPVAQYRCDGLILSTPVGSTAHNLSAGGPILRKGLDCIVISPISPHTLSNRPVVDSADRTYEVQMLSDHGALVIDGVLISSVAHGDRIEVRRADVTFKTLDIPDHCYYHTLREKLGWSGHFQYISKGVASGE